MGQWIEPEKRPLYPFEVGQTRYLEEGGGYFYQECGTVKIFDNRANECVVQHDSRGEWRGSARIYAAILVAPFALNNTWYDVVAPKPSGTLDRLAVARRRAVILKGPKIFIGIERTGPPRHTRGYWVDELPGQWGTINCDGLFEPDEVLRTFRKHKPEGERRRRLRPRDGTPAKPPVLEDA